MKKMLTISASEYILMKQYIEEHCGIYLEEGKEYLIESRLYDIVKKTGADSFQEFHFKARTDYTGKLKDRIIDAMTTNETLWFRDESVWIYLQEVAVPFLFKQAETNGWARVWSAAASTGQEAYSLAMILDDEANKRGCNSLLKKIEILGTDISCSSLSIARNGCYDDIAMNRGLPAVKKAKYFQKKSKGWEIDPKIKKMVSFKVFNLQNSFVPLGIFDFILCRYVVIYFSDFFKRNLFAKLAHALKPGCSLILGATESLRGLSDEFEISYYKDTMISRKKLLKEG
ncbi:chemotaxis protein methyltransferase CheR [Candidatus Magnetomoraceae bacterium gMMP-13]